MVCEHEYRNISPPPIIELATTLKTVRFTHFQLFMNTNSVLGYDHIPDHIKVLIKSLYTNFKTSIITSSFNTPFIPVGRGVLQGDCLSPLLFNLCFNTFIQHIKFDQYRQFGFSHKLLNPIHWFQFADDASVITSLETENQHLLNRFSLWCHWSDMIIRVDKCSTFGIKKAVTKSIQYLPKLFINNCVIPTAKLERRFATWEDTLTLACLTINTNPN